jgi:hypothetical protein
MELEITLEGRLTVEPDVDGVVCDSPEVEIERAFDSTMQELLKLDIIDPSVFGSVRAGEIIMSCIVEAESWDEAVMRADSAFRSALHAAGVSTPQWDSPLCRIDYTPVAKNAKLVDA